jgi:putative ABC transport system permease protein
VSTPWSLVRKHLTDHWVRSLLTVSAIALAMFLFSFVRSIVTTLDNAVSAAANNRLVVQSSVSLFVDLPLDYQAKIEALPGVDQVSKMQWFGADFVDEQGEPQFFAQFGVDHEWFFDMYRRDMEIVVGPGGMQGEELDAGAGSEEEMEAVRGAALAALRAERRGCIVGQGAAQRYGWNVGDTIPLQARIFSKLDGSAWEFVVCGIYKPLRENVDDQTLWFRWDYLLETMEAEGAEDLGTGVFMVNMDPGASAETLTAAIDGLFENGPRKTLTTTEAAFQAMFVSMLGSLPEYTAAIGGAIVFAVFFSVVNTMLLAARQRRQSTGILKALGFGNGAITRLLLAEALVLSLGGGGLGLGIAKLAEEGMRVAFGPNLPGYAVDSSTLLTGLSISLAVGIVAGLGPAWQSSRLSPVDALRSE